MATYSIYINERMSIGKAILAMLRSIPQAVSIEMPAQKSQHYKELDNAFKDVKLMIDGKKEKQSLDSLIYELRSTDNR